jgi:hypothetical protein
MKKLKPEDEKGCMHATASEPDQRSVCVLPINDVAPSPSLHVPRGLGDRTNPQILGNGINLSSESVASRVRVQI